MLVWQEVLKLEAFLGEAGVVECSFLLQALVAGVVRRVSAVVVKFPAVAAEVVEQEAEELLEELYQNGQLQLKAQHLLLRYF